MRELKFRAWNNNDRDYTHFDLSTVSIYDIQLNIVSIEQYTGLKDKNGVEIYEGDVGVFNGHVCVIKYRSNYCDFVFMVIKYKSRLLNLTRANVTKSDFKVIGNIHENPELL